MNPTTQQTPDPLGDMFEAMGVTVVDVTPTTQIEDELDELIGGCDFQPEELYSRKCKWCGELKGLSIHTLKADILAWHERHTATKVREAVEQAEGHYYELGYRTAVTDYTVGHKSGELNQSEISKREQLLLDELEALDEKESEFMGDSGLYLWSSHIADFINAKRSK